MKKELRKSLIEWAIAKFGEVSVQDIFNMKEQIVQNKEGLRVREIIMFLKKRKGIQQEWLDPEVFKRWVGELKAIVGENLKLNIFSTEGNELRFTGGDVKGKYEEMAANYYNYQFKLEAWKKMGRN